MDAAAAKARVREEVDRIGPRLVEISRDLHANPELMWEEFHAHDVLTNEIEAAGIDVVRSAHGLETAFRADIGSGAGPLVAVCCEYDALPDIGHACGHNVIAAAGLGAGLAAAVVADEMGGRVRILGTPAEEGGNGKGWLLARGGFEDVDAAVMIHPGDKELRSMTTMSAAAVEVTFLGAASHAAAGPWLGRNALDAAVAAYTNVGLMRQQLAPDQRVHGAFTEVPNRSNVIPERVVMRWVARGRTMASMMDAMSKVVPCIEAGAAAARCDIEIEEMGAGSQVLDNDVLVDLYAANAAQLGRTVADPEVDGHVFGSTDMGEISRNFPSIHAVIAVAPRGVSIHQRDFAAAAGSELGDKAVLDGAAALAMTLVDVWANPNLLDDAREEMEQSSKADPIVGPRRAVF